jgi:hypothetical protein
MMMASQKVRPSALQRLFKTSTYNLYAFTLEQPLRLGVRNFCLATLFVLRDHHGSVIQASRIKAVAVNM